MTRYPCTLFYIKNQGTEFTGTNFNLSIKVLNIQYISNNVKNTQAKIIIEHINKTNVNMILFNRKEKPPENDDKVLGLVDSVDVL